MKDEFLARFAELSEEKIRSHLIKQFKFNYTHFSDKNNLEEAINYVEEQIEFFRNHDLEIAEIVGLEALGKLKSFNSSNEYLQFLLDSPGETDEYLQTYSVLGLDFKFPNNAFQASLIASNIGRLRDAIDNGNIDKESFKKLIANLNTEQLDEFLKTFDFSSQELIDHHLMSIEQQRWFDSSTSKNFSLEKTSSFFQPQPARESKESSDEESVEPEFRNAKP